MAHPFPNFVYILADDMGYGDLSCLNPNSKIHTVHLDALAADGMIFQNAHSSSAVCTPSRYSLLTGRYNWRSRLKQGVLWGYSAPLIEPDRMTVPSLLRSLGYATGCVGKWHLGWTWAQNRTTPEQVDFSKPIQNGPLSAGFDYFFGISASLDMPPYVYVENDRPTAVPEQTVPARDGKAFWREGPVAPDFRFEEVLDRFTEKACEWIAQQTERKRPFFLYFPLSAPHTPILPAPRFQGKSGTNEYGDFCLHVDDVVGRIAALLNHLGIAENTLIAFAADNGCSPMADFAELARIGHHPSYVFRGHKADIYEGGHRIPFLVRWPARIPSGSVCRETVCLSDLLATCADLLKVSLPPNAGEDSLSLLPLWEKTPSLRPIREATVHHSVDGSFAIRKGRWKLELCPGSGGWSHPRPGPECEGLPSVQLYDLEADVGERRNLQAEHPEIVGELTTLMTRYVEQGRSTPGPRQPNTGPDRWPQLWWMLDQAARA